jgi:hypothetical protein
MHSLHTRRNTNLRIIQATITIDIDETRSCCRTTVNTTMCRMRQILMPVFKGGGGGWVSKGRRRREIFFSLALQRRVVLCLITLSTDTVSVEEVIAAGTRIRSILMPLDL